MAGPHNYRESSTRKRGRPTPSKLSVRLFLLDPDNRITKVTKEACSKKGIEDLMQKGCGPPRPEHCTKDDKVEFALELTNEQFKQKLVEVYPVLENTCFVFMKADKQNILGELNPGRCCFRCYTPESVYKSERGQGRLYIQKIAENEISSCTHGISLSKRLCAMVGGNQQFYVPILPKPVPALTTGVDVVTSVSMPTDGELPILGAVPTLQTESGQPFQNDVSMLTQSQLSSSINTLVNPQDNGSGSLTTQGPLPVSRVVSQTVSRSPLKSSVSMFVQSHSPTSTQIGSCQAVSSYGNILSMVPQLQLPAPAVVSQIASISPLQNSSNVFHQSLLPTSTVVSQDGPRQPVHGSGSMVPQLQLPWSTIVSQTASRRPALQSSVNYMSVQSMSPKSTAVSLIGSSRPVQSIWSPWGSRIVSPTPSISPLQSSSNAVVRSHSPFVSHFLPSQLVPSSHNNVAEGQLSSSNFVSQFSTSQPVPNAGIVVAHGELPTLTYSVSGNASMPPFQSFGNIVTQGKLQTVSGSTTRQGQFSRSTGVSDANFVQPIVGATSQIASFSHEPLAAAEQDLLTQLKAILKSQDTTTVGNDNGNLDMNILPPTGTEFQMTNMIGNSRGTNIISNSIVTPSSIPPSVFPVSERLVQSPGLNALANAAIIQQEERTGFPTSNAISSNMQGALNLSNPSELSIEKFLENVESSGKLEISLEVLDKDAAYLKKLTESTIQVHTVEIRSTCEVHNVLSVYSLPSSVKVLRIKNNNLNYDDIFAIAASGMSGLNELDLSRTKFKDGSFSSFVSVLIRCSNLTELSLTDNGLTKQDVTCLTAALRLMKNLNSLNLSKSNMTEKQVNDILQIHEQARNIVSLDLSQNALQGNKIIIGICQLQSLKELNISHNCIRFSPLPNSEEQRNNLPINMKIISLSFNHMMPNDISQFCSLIRSNLQKLILDSNHVSSSIWSLCSLGLRIRHLKVLSLANTNIRDAVDGLAFLLSLVLELEKLNLSSNNLVLKDFQQLRSPLSNLAQLKKFNLSNNPDGISFLLHEILPSLKYLEELRLSNVHLNGDDLSKICDSLASLKGLKYLDLSMNVLGPVGTRALANIMKEFPLLNGLELSQSSLTESDVNVLCNSLGPVKGLKYLNLSGSRIDIDALADEFFLPPMLEELTLSDIIHGQKLFVRMIPLRYLRKLHLTNLKLRACDAEALAAMLSSFPKLEELSLAHIFVADLNFEKLFGAVKLLKNVKKIDLSGIRLPDGNALADMISSLFSLEELVLVGMNVANMDCENILRAVGVLKYLRKLDLRVVEMSDSKAMFEMLSSLTLLEEIMFPDIGIMHTDHINFSALESLRYLKNLDLRRTTIVHHKTHKNINRVISSLSLALLEKLALGRLDCQCGDHYDWDPTQLNLERTYIEEEDVGSLAEMLQSRQLLEKLVLNNIECDDENEEQLFSALGQLKYLRKLSLNFPTKTEPLVELFPSLQVLEKLMLRYIGNWEDYGGENPDNETLFAAIGKLKYLKELVIIACNDNYCSYIILQAFAAALPSLLLLEKLTLSVDYLCHDETEVGEDEKKLFAAVGQLKFLRELSVIGSEITQTGVEALAEAIPSLQLLEKLKLSYTEFDSKTEKQLFSALHETRYLKELDLGRIDISETGMETLAEALPTLQCLEKVVFHRIELRGKDQRRLFAALGKLGYRLKELGLCCSERLCQMCIDTDALLADMLSSLPLLVKFELRGVELKNLDDQQLFTAIKSLIYLEQLFFYLTEITQTTAATLPAVLTTLPGLKHFCFHKIESDQNGSLKRKLEEELRLACPGLKIW